MDGGTGKQLLYRASALVELDSHKRILFRFHRRTPVGIPKPHCHDILPQKSYSSLIDCMQNIIFCNKV